MPIRIPGLNSFQGGEPISKEEQDKYAKAVQEKDSPIKKKLRGMFESGMNLTSGFLGLPTEERNKSAIIGELIQAGLPFSVLGKKLGIDRLYHGAPKPFEYFDLTKNNPGDTLGWMVHAAETPEYAEQYATKLGMPASYSSLSKWMAQKQLVNPRPNIIPITPKSENVLDITQYPKGEDLEKVVEGLKMWDPMKSPFRDRDRLTPERVKSLLDDIPNIKMWQGEEEGRKDAWRMTGQDYENYLDVGTKPSRESKWLKDARIIFNDPNISDKLGFDAVRYTDVDEPSWAFPDPSKLVTPWGTPLGKEMSKDIKLARGGETKYVLFDPKTGNHVSDPIEFKEVLAKLNQPEYKGMDFDELSNIEGLSPQQTVKLSGIEKKELSIGNQEQMDKMYPSPIGGEQKYIGMGSFSGKPIPEKIKHSTYAPGKHKFVIFDVNTGENIAFSPNFEHAQGMVEKNPDWDFEMID